MSDLFFRRLVIEDWRQFAKVEMDFHRHLTVITGTNGSGKSTILRILAQHFGWASTMISSPIRDRSGTLHYRIRRSRKRSNDPSREDLGIIEYSSGHRSKVNLIQWRP